MKLLQNMYSYVQGLDRKQIRNYVTIFFGIVLLLCAVIVYQYFSSMSSLQQRLSAINRKRREIRELLERYERVKKQQAEVDSLLAKDPTFKIAGYFDSVIKNLDLEQHKTRNPETSSQELDNGYTEITLFATFNNINTEKLTQLLDTLEQNERIYTKELEVYKGDNQQTINVNVLIATVEPRKELPEETES